MRRAEAPLAALAALLAAVTLARLPWAWESGNALNHVSGAWITLADDLVRGTLYRPMHDPALGFGGTRFFPLAFALHAAVVRLGAPLLAAGYAVSLGAGVLLVLAVLLLVRRTGAGKPAAAAAAVLALSGFAGQHALAAIRGDLLAVALQALGLAAIARGRTGSGAGGPAGAGAGAVAAAALAFTLAFAAKPTALTAAAAAAAWLLLRRERRAALALCAATAAGAAAVVLATDLLSGGRFLALLAASAGGGMGLADVLRAPLRVALQLLHGDRAGLVLLAGAAIALAALPWGRARASLARGPEAGADREALAPFLPALWLGAAAAGALVVFASPGTGVNHLLELEVAAAAVLGAAAAQPIRWAALARLAAPGAALAGLVVAVGVWRADLRGGRLAEIDEVLALAPPAALLAEDPLVPLRAGRRPVVLDPWMLRLAAESDPGAAAPLLAALRQRSFAAVVLFQDLDGPEADAWYRRGNLGPALVEEIRRSYRLAGRVGRYFLYLPAPVESPEPGTSAPARAATL